MKKVVRYPCSRCKCLRDGVLIIDQYVSDNCQLIRMKLSCGHEDVQLWDTKSPIYKRYIKEAPNDNHS